jgi:hypothetical protein
MKKLKGGKLTFKKLPLLSVNCSPYSYSKKNKRVMNSCYNDTILLKIRNSYNKKHQDKIKTKNPKKMYNELKLRLTSCDKEDCWLKQLNDKDRNDINELFFSPKMPETWKTNKEEWLSNYDILSVLKQYEIAYPNFKFFEPSPIDFDTKIGNSCVSEELCKFDLKKYNGKNKFGIIFNTDKHNESGSHWVSLFIDVENKIIFYFNSSGETAPPEIKNLINRINKKKYFKYYENNIEYQKGNNACGIYSTFFIVTMLTGKSWFKDNLTIDEKIDLFKNNPIPDDFINQYRYIFFNR